LKEALFTMDGKEEKNENLPFSDGIDQESRSKNMTGRIYDSATGLLQDAFSPHGSQPAKTLARTVASEGKAGPSSASVSAGPGGASEFAGEIGSGKGAESLPASSFMFRESTLANGRVVPAHSDASQGMSLDQFTEGADSGTDIPLWQYDSDSKGKQPVSGVESVHFEAPALDRDISAAWDGAASGDASISGPFGVNGQAPTANALNRASEPEETDGAEVLNLLQDPSFQPSFWADEMEEPDPLFIISAEDVRIAEELVHRLDAAIGLTPSFETVTTAAKQGHPFLGFSSFFDDVENYHDEVWGHLRPIVEAAKREFESSASSAEQEGPATRRLRMILAHIDGSR
jgi:hypothetical protein